MEKLQVSARAYDQHFKGRARTAADWGGSIEIGMEHLVNLSAGTSQAEAIQYRSENPEVI